MHVRRAKLPSCLLCSETLPSRMKARLGAVPRLSKQHRSTPSAGLSCNSVTRETIRTSRPSASHILRARSPEKSPEQSTHKALASGSCTNKRATSCVARVWRALGAALIRIRDPGCIQISRFLLDLLVRPRKARRASSLEGRPRIEYPVGYDPGASSSRGWQFPLRTIHHL
jgi:hypothetical protein